MPFREEILFDICVCIDIWHVLTVSFKLKRFLASCMCNVIIQSGS